MTDVSLDVNHGHRTNDLLDGRNLGDDHRDVLVGRRMNATGDRNDPRTGVNLGVSLCRRMNGRLGDLKMVVSRVNRNYAPRDLKMVLMKCHRVDLPIDPECYVMNHHVKRMVFLNMSCDRMSHDHLRYGHQVMRHRDTNRMDGMNLDGKMKNSGAMNSGARMI